ncbi:MAG: NADPH:quinone reductase [Bacillota bacterium]
MRTIRVHQFGNPEVLKLEEVPDPRPTDGQVLVRAKAIGVNPVETYIRAGKYGPREFPFTPGTDVAGLVEAVGPGIKHVKPGDRVYTSGSITGAYAELALCKESQVHPLPKNCSFEQGAALGIPYATAYRGLFHRAAAHAGETVLVHGASGGVGTAAVQFARAAGMTVIGTAGSDQGRRLVAEQGAHHVLDHTRPDYLQQLMHITDGRGVDVILEMLANVNLAKDLGALARHGRVVVIGSRDTIEIDPRNTMARDTDIRGMSLANATDEELRGIYMAITAGLENGTLRPIIGTTLPLPEAPRAHEQIYEPATHGKIILIP